MIDSFIQDHNGMLQGRKVLRSRDPRGSPIVLRLFVSTVAVEEFLGKKTTEWKVTTSRFVPFAVQLSLPTQMYQLCLMVLTPLSFLLCNVLSSASASPLLLTTKALQRRVLDCCHCAVRGHRVCVVGVDCYLRDQLHWDGHLPVRVLL